MKTNVMKKAFVCAALIFMVIAVMFAGMKIGTGAEAASENVIRIAHISDMHVMIEEYCNVYSDKYVAETKVTKLLEETPMIAEAVFEDLYNMNEKAPMYVFITGDITSNGEYANHEWLSKLYKAFTERMRSRTDYDFSGFQIFLSPGNHDLYNTRAKSFMPSDEELAACADDDAREELIRSYESRPVASITSKQFMDLYADFGYCDCPDRKNGHHLTTCGMVDGCSIEYFFESDYWYDDETERSGAGLEVRDPSKATIDAFEDSDKDYNIYNPDARFGACSYIARMDGFDVISLDANTRGFKYEDWRDDNEAVYSCGGWHESTGGMVSEDQLRWVLTSIEEDVAANKVMFALGHTNFLPHFDTEDEVISLFTYDNWEQASYTLADAGVRYLFSGHQHASDITSYVTQNGHVVYDIEAGSLASYACAWRTIELTVKTDAAGNYTEDFVPLAHNLNYSPFVYGVYKTVSDTDTTKTLLESPVELFRGYEADLMPYTTAGGMMILNKKISADPATEEQIGIADLLAVQMYNMAGSLEYGIAGEYVGDNIYKLLDGLTEKLSTMPYTGGIVSALVDGLKNIDLCPFTFNGNSYSVGSAPQAGYDLADLTYDLASFLLQYDFSGSKKQGLTLAKAFVVIYGGHLSGAHTAEGDEEIAPLIEMLKSGAFVRKTIELLENVLFPQLEILLDAPIRFDETTPALTAKGFDITEALSGTPGSSMADGVVKMLIDTDILLQNTDNKGYSSLRLILKDVGDILPDILYTKIDQIKNSTVQIVAGVARGLVQNLSISKYYDRAIAYLNRITGGETLRSVVDSELVDKYVTDAFCKNLGAYGARILTDMNVDETEDGSRWVEGDRYKRFPVENFTFTVTVKNNGTVAYDGHTYKRTTDGKDALTVIPSASNGLLPNMISVSFNEDIYTEKNIRWFTAAQVDVFDKDAIPDSYICYSESEDMADAVTVKAVGKNVDKVLPTIDLGITFINMNHVYKTYNDYTVKLSGLKAGTTYYYRLGKEGAWTKTFSFATASEGEFTFMAIADIQGSIEENYILSDVSMQKALDFLDTDLAFIASAGDNVDNGKNVLQYTWLLNDQQEVWANNTFITAAGNHEKSAHALDSVIALPDNAVITGETGYYYSFDYNSVHFIVLNTNDLDKDNYLAAENWLIHDLDEERDTVWTIVLLHKGPYTAGSHAFDRDVIALREELSEIFAEYEIDLVLQGHDHTYSVSEFIGEDGEKVTAYQNGNLYRPEGVLYINLGTMGDKFYDYIYSEDVDLADRTEVDERISAYFTADDRLELTETPVFASITVNENKLTVKTYTIVGDEIVPVDDVTIARTLEMEIEPKPTIYVDPAILPIAGVVALVLVIGVVALIAFKKRGK